jgi:uncharacterized RDD family membrane protein YckC
VSEASQGEGWWQASDGKWYPPDPPAATPTPAGHASPVAVNAAVPLPAGVASANPWIRLGSYLLEAVLMTVTLFIGWLIWAAMIGGTGQTPAKKLLGLRVIRADSIQPAGLGRMFWMRGILAGFIAYFATLVTVGIILFMPFWDKRNQNLWDKISTTYVVTDPNDAWNTRPAIA